MTVSQRSYPFSRGGRLHVEISGGPVVRMIGREGEGIEMRAQLPQGDPDRYLETRSEAGEFWLSLEGAPGELAVEIGVPAVCDLELENGGATVEVRGLSGRIGLDCGSGPVRLMEIAGELRADTGSGGLWLQGFTGRRLAVDSGSGEVRLLAVDAWEVEIDGGSGAVTAAFSRLRPGGRYQVDGGSGRVQLLLPPRVAAVVRTELRPERLQVENGRLVLWRPETYLLGEPGSDPPVLELRSGRVRLTVAGGSDHSHREDEITRVLQLVAEGRITPEAGEELLAALEGKADGGPEAGPGA